MTETEALSRIMAAIERKLMELRACPSERADRTRHRDPSLSTEGMLPEETADLREPVSWFRATRRWVLRRKCDRRRRRIPPDVPALTSSDPSVGNCSLGC
jgi:hypothetical protein